MVVACANTGVEIERIVIKTVVVFNIFIPPYHSTLICWHGACKTH